jgi:hypothetical protein
MRPVTTYAVAHRPYRISTGSAAVARSPYPSSTLTSTGRSGIAARPSSRAAYRVTVNGVQRRSFSRAICSSKSPGETDQRSVPACGSSLMLW